ncbi:MAG: hypothetical protein ACXVLT_01035 [Flavisolibacter sp.]
MQKSILYIAASTDEAYECAYSILKYLEVYNLKPPTDHSLVLYTNFPHLLEAYGTFFNRFQLRPIPANMDKQSIISEFEKEAGGNVLYFTSNEYPVTDVNSLESVQSYKGLQEFRVLLKDFFKRYQEESVPNQVKLIRNVDPKRIEKEKKRFETLPLASKWFKKIMGKGWNISNYLVRV